MKPAGGIVFGIIAASLSSAADAACSWSTLQNYTVADADQVMHDLECLAPLVSPQLSGTVSIRNDSSVSQSYLKILNATNGAGSEARLDIAGGSLGNLSELTIAQYAPSHTGNILGVSTGGLSVVLENTAPGYGSGLAIGTVSNSPLTLGTSNTNRLTIAGSGNVGIATSSPSYTLHVNGSVAGTSGYTNLSDIRMKKNIATIANSIDILEHIRGVRFDWRLPAERSVGRDVVVPTGGHQIGFIAQELAKVLPEAVTMSSDGIYSVSESKVVPILVEVAKRQQRRVDTLEAALRRQLSENAEANKRIASYERRVFLLERRAKWN